MYAAVPRMTPRMVIAGEVMVGEFALSGSAPLIDTLGEAEVEHLDGAVSPQLDIGRLQIAMDDAARVRRFQRLGNLPRDLHRFNDRDRAARNALRRSSPSTNSITSAWVPEDLRSRRSTRCEDD